ncbi:hypothetical protein T492DRAFT_836054 [Pavlovales sp. CCMP2436]|nr:hypothetical protein T492DRAFT_836054 [Pavlovales sp. CCMP2436]
MADGPVATKIAMTNHDDASMAFYYLQAIDTNEAFFDRLNSILSALVKAAPHLNNKIATEAAHLPPELLGLNICNMHAEAHGKSNPSNHLRKIWPPLLQQSNEAFEMMAWELTSTQTQLSTSSLAQLLPFLRESNKSKRYQLLARMTGAQASPFMTPQSTFPAKDPNTNLNKIEHAILRGATEEREQLAEKINNTPRDRRWSSEALAIMQNSGHTIG